MHTTLTLVTHVLAATSSGSTKKSGNNYGFLVLIALFALAYFVFLRPARKRQRSAAQARKQFEIGDEVTTTAGLIARVVAADDTAVTLEVAPGVHSRYLPAAILRVNEPEQPEQPEQSTDGVIEHEAIRPEDPGQPTSGT